MSAIDLSCTPFTRVDCLRDRPCDIAAILSDLDNCGSLWRRGNGLAAAGPELLVAPTDADLLLSFPAFGPENLGDPEFLEAHGVRLAYMVGAMADGIASPELVIAMGRAGLLGSYGAGGVHHEQADAAIGHIMEALGDSSFAVNLIHSPAEAKMERDLVDCLLRRGVKTVEASAFMALTPELVRYRAAGLKEAPDGSVAIGNKVIAKLSRLEVARRFLMPAPDNILRDLVSRGDISDAQADMAKRVPLADDITAEADSGGHTDRRPLAALLPALIDLRDQVAANHPKMPAVRIGAAGGLGTPKSIYAAFELGAAYVVTGSINQACVESGTSETVKRLLAQATMTDVTMAPAADMFEMGVELQVLQRGTMFAARAGQLYQLYKAYPSLEALPDDVVVRLERQIFQRPIQQVWEEAVDYFERRDPQQIERAKQDPKRRMALVFRSYLGQSSGWAKRDEKGRNLDFQIWCGPAMGAFNAWASTTSFADRERRKVADVAVALMQQAARLARLAWLRHAGIGLPIEVQQCLRSGGSHPCRGGDWNG